MGVAQELQAEAHGRAKTRGGGDIKVNPVLDYILIHRTNVDVSDGGIHLLPGHEKLTGPKYAKVVAAGPGRPSEWNAEIIPMPGCKPGDTILYHGGAGTEWEHEGKTYYWILPGDLIGVVG